MSTGKFRAGRAQFVGARQQRGAATIIVVSMLFFLVALVAAYANRNLIFEQRTSANQQRSTLAFEAADAGVEWAVAMLNLGRVDTSCKPLDDNTATSFRDRYLEIDNNTGLVQPRPNLTAGSLPTCVYNGAQWLCSCPSTGAPSIAGAPTDIVAPAFRLRFVQRAANRAGTIWVEVQACTRLDDGCLGFGAINATAGEGRARTTALLALRSALPSSPVAALAARGTINLNNTAVSISNPRQGNSPSLAIQAGGVLINDSALQLSGAAGELVTVQMQVLSPDPSLASTVVPTGARFFGSFFGIQPAIYSGQPATLTLACNNIINPCNADGIRAVAARNPGRILWAQGNVDLDGGAALGSAAEPVILIVEGNLTTRDIQINGLVYGRSSNWTFSGINTTLQGAVIAENDLVLSGSVALIRNADILDLLRWRHGSFVRVPGGWSDY
jgi:hypothetical protein